VTRRARTAPLAAGLVALLVSDLGSWITGACFTVDGGIVRSVF